jgi:hypothetical protein
MTRPSISSPDVKLMNQCYGGDIDFFDYGFRLIANEFTDWVIKNREGSIGFTPSLSN